MKIHPVLAFGALAAVGLPTAAYCDDASDLRLQIVQGCDLKMWQFDVRIEQGGAIIPLLSPTMQPEKRKCALKMLDTFRHDQTGH